MVEGRCRGGAGDTDGSNDVRMGGPDEEKCGKGGWVEWQPCAILNLLAP